MKLIKIFILLIFQAQRIHQFSTNVPAKFCEFYAAKPVCDPTYKYRSMNGFCNNLRNPKWGAKDNFYERVLRARYQDGISEIIGSVVGGPLPSARKLSLELFNNLNVSSGIYTLALPQIGQLLVEDEGLNPDVLLKLPCCFPNGTLEPSRHPSCLYIPIEPSDPTYSKQPRQCMNFLRVVTDLSSNCEGYQNTGPVNPINGVSAYIDLSNIYGSYDEESNVLRAFMDGLLKTRTIRGSEYPLHMTKEQSLCPEDNEIGRCYFSGDVRTNEYPPSTTVSIMFMREHNRLARELRHINPHWDDERLFQEARRINIAQFQHIVLYHYFVELLGKSYMQEHELISNESGGESYNTYDPNLNINLITEHATAAHRFFHTMVKGVINLVSKCERKVETFNLKDTYFRPSIVQTDNFMDDLSRGLCRQSAGELDGNIDDGIREFLFRDKTKFASDLKALDIQRGRDHGLGSYNDAREYCGLPRATTWTGFSDEIPQADIDRMRQVYKHPDDVELTVGGALERIVADAACGKTYQCIMAKQVYKSRSGDRFWYETSDSHVKFTKKQLKEIKKVTFARILCNNGRTITKMQRNVFRLPSDENPIVDCSFIPMVNLRKWRECPRF